MYLVLDTAGFHLVGEDLCTVLLRFSFVDVFHEHTLVLEDVTLGLLVKRVVAIFTHELSRTRMQKPESKDSQVLINLARFSVFP
jgi:hypothetical protein